MQPRRGPVMCLAHVNTYPSVLARIHDVLSPLVAAAAVVVWGLALDAIPPPATATRPPRRRRLFLCVPVACTGPRHTRSNDPAAIRAAEAAQQLGWCGSHLQCRMHPDWLHGRGVTELGSRPSGLLLWPAA